MVHNVKLVSHSGVLIEISGAQLPIQLPANVSVKIIEGGLSASSSGLLA